MEELINNLNDAILRLWANSAQDLNLEIEGNNNQIPLLWPSCYYIPPENVKILFIGLNPSDSFPGVRRFVPNDVNYLLFHNIHQQNFEDALLYNGQVYTAQNIAELEAIAFNNHNYFGKFRRLGNYIINGDDYNNQNLAYYHIDLFQFRLQNSNIFLEIKNNNPTFFDNQIARSIGLIRLLKPGLIFVANIHASALIIQGFGNNWNENTGCHIINENDWKCNVFLSGMITQTRAIDNYSFQRLKWHMKSIYDGGLMIL